MTDKDLSNVPMTTHVKWNQIQGKDRAALKISWAEMNHSETVCGPKFKRTDYSWRSDKIWSDWMLNGKGCDQDMINNQFFSSIKWVLNFYIQLFTIHILYNYNL